MKLFRISLAWQMALATLLGVAVGLFFGEKTTVFAPWGSAYIMILKITTVPYLICTIIHGIGQLYTGQALQMLKKGLFFIGLTWLVNITIIYMIFFLLPSRIGSQSSHYVSTIPAHIDFAHLLIPENIFYVLTNNIIPAIVIFSLLIGISLMHIAEKSALMQVLGVLVNSLTGITSWVCRITPIGTFLIIAHQAGTIQTHTIKQVSTYIIVYIFAALVLVFWIFPRIVSMMINISMFRWLRDIFPILLLAYTTSAVIVCLPFIIELIRREMQQFLSDNKKNISEIQSIVSIMFNLPLGSLFLCAFVFFVSVLYNSPLVLANQIQLFVTSFLTSLGSVGLGGWLNSLGFILDTLGLPRDAINIYLTTVPFTSGFQAMISVTEIATLAFLIAMTCHKLIVLRPWQIVRRSACTFVPLIGLTLIVKSYNPLPQIYNDTRSIFEMRIPDAVHVSALIRPKATFLSDTEDPLYRILRTKVLRIGCNIDSPPYCFENAVGEIIGYDMAYAYALADELGCEVKLVPMDYKNIATELTQNLYDIGMSAITISTSRLERMYFTRAYMDAPIIFVGKEKMKHTLAVPYALEDDLEIQIAVLKGSAHADLAATFFPHHPLIHVKNLEDFFSGATTADILLLSEPEAISWIIRYPSYTLIRPCPDMGQDTLGYGIRQGADLLLHFLNTWLVMKEKEGFQQEQRDLWIEGKTQDTSSHQPRWSFLKDVLHR